MALQKLWGGNFWTSGYYANTVGQYSNEEVIKRYVENRGKTGSYEKLHFQQLKLFRYPTALPRGSSFDVWITSM